MRPDRPSSFAEIDRQDGILNDWAKANGFFIDPREIENVKNAADLTFGGQEHDVWVFRRGYDIPFVIRRTRNGGYGLRDRTPGEYLDRWKLTNAVFPDTAVSLIGYTKDIRGNGVILTAQRYFEGNKRPQKAIDAAMKQLGFEKMAGGEPSYRHPESMLEIHDAKPDNIIFDKAGNMIPFDVWINDPANLYGICGTPEPENSGQLSETTPDWAHGDQSEQAPGESLANAEAHLSRSLGGSRSTLPGQRKTRREAERAALVEWAQQNGVLFRKSPFSKFVNPRISRHGEHDVAFDAATGRWWKATYGNTAGVAPEFAYDDLPPFAISSVSAVEATPLQYLRRMMLLNREFGGTVELEGVWLDPHEPRIVVSQADVHGRPSTRHEMRALMMAYGYVEVQMASIGKSRALSFVHPVRNIALFDAHEGNFRVDADGDIHIVDAILAELTPDESRFLAEREGTTDPAHSLPPLHLTAIVAMTPDRVIGRDGTMPWHLPGDLAFFKRTTVNHPVVMGRKTYESIGKPLPRRRNIVLTRDPAWSAPGVETIHDPADLASLPDLTGRVFIIGGAEIYRIFLPLIEEIFITHVHANPPGDTVFPAFEDQFVAGEILETTPEFTIRSWRRRADH